MILCLQVLNPKLFRSQLLFAQPPVCENGVNIVRKKRQVVELDESDGSEVSVILMINVPITILTTTTIITTLAITTPGV